MEVKQIKLEHLKEYENNPRQNDEAVDKVAESIKEFGFKVPIIVDENMKIIAGHTRKKAALKLGLDEVPVIVADDLNEDQIKAFRLADNKVAEFSEWDIELLMSELEEIEMDMEEFGFEELEEELPSEIYEEHEKGSLNRDYLIPPFSILDTKQGDWLKQRKEWLELGIRSEIGRDDSLIFDKNIQTKHLGGTSIFDPLLCELMYKWFIPNKTDNILDPFAGGSVRGVVAERSGYKYTGIDLRKEQIDANINNAKEIGCDLNNINWINGDSNDIDKLVEKNDFDLLFTCPPYYDLEVYSDDQKDISNMSYQEFCKIYESILIKSANKIKDDRFAVVVISDVRDKKGYYRDLTGVTKRSFEKAGFKLYNDLILANSIGTAALRARRAMKNRKQIRVHQNILVFYKGNEKNIQKNIQANRIR